MEDADYFEGSAAEWGNEADGGAVSAGGAVRREAAARPGPGAACEGSAARALPRDPLLPGVGQELPGPLALQGGESASVAKSGGWGSLSCGGAWGSERGIRGETTSRRCLVLRLHFWEVVFVWGGKGESRVIKVADCACNSRTMRMGREKMMPKSSKNA